MGTSLPEWAAPRGEALPGSLRSRKPSLSSTSLRQRCCATNGGLDRHKSQSARGLPAGMGPRVRGYAEAVLARPPQGAAICDPRDPPRRRECPAR